MQMDRKVRFRVACVFSVMIFIASTPESKETSANFSYGSFVAHRAAPVSNGISLAAFMMPPLPSSAPSESSRISNPVPESSPISAHVLESPPLSAIVPISAEVPEPSPKLAGNPIVTPVPASAPSNMPPNSEGSPPTIHVISSSVPPSSPPNPSLRPISSSVPPSSPPSPTIHVISSSLPPSSPPSHFPAEHKPLKGRSPSVETPAPSVPVRAASMPPSSSVSLPSLPPDSSQGQPVATAPISSSNGVPGKAGAAAPGISGSPHSNGPASSSSSSSFPITHGKSKNGPTATPPQIGSPPFPPASSPVSNGDTEAPTISPTPPVPNTQLPKRTVWAPAPAPIKAFQQHSGNSSARGPAVSPSHSHPPTGTANPPLPSLPPGVTKKNRTRHDSDPPSHSQDAFSPKQSPLSPKPAPGVLAPSPSSVAPPRHNSGFAHSPEPSHAESSALSPAGQTQRPIHMPSPSPSPSRTTRMRQGAPIPATSKALPPLPPPMPHPMRALPPPPPNLECMPLSCMDPLTNSPPGSPCLCVRPIKVGLRLTVPLYTFFPLVSDLAKEISLGTSMKQSQVRIMGANADDQPEKTIVLIDLVPLGKKFDYSTVLSISQKFWHKQVGIQTTIFGEYDVLYVSYPGLPPSPPLPPSDLNVDGVSYGNGSNSRTIHPVGVDVRKYKKKLGSSVIAIIILSSVIALVLFLGIAWFFVSKRSNQDHLPAQTVRTPFPPFSKAPGIGPVMFGSKPSSTSGSFSSNMATYTGTAKTFSAAEIERATTKFDESRIIGEGGFGCVYEGILDDGTRVAVKVLKREDQQGGREFLAEVEMLSRLHHRNLVKLIGICTEENLRCLIYELIPNGSVESHLHGVDKETAPLDWGSRMKIALGSARGLAYLHEDSSPRVIHRDFKSSNILLEQDFIPKVSDFGLARTALEGNEHISTRVMGTFGYVAPEYAMTGHLLVKSDVYSYGVVLLELLTGRKPVDMQQPPGQENLVTWARPLLTSKEGLEMIIDPALGPNFPMDDISKVAAIASMCVQPEVSHRPFMGEVVQALKLVCSEIDGHRASGSSWQDLSIQDPEPRTNNVLGPNTERVISASEIFSTGLTRDTSGSFRRHSSSGPLTTRRKGYFWQKFRGLSKGSSSDHDQAHRFKDDQEGGQMWP